jgi:hypothetical protein
MRISKLTGLGAALLLLACAFLAGCGDDSTTIMQPADDDAIAYGTYDDLFDEGPNPYEPRGDVYDDPNADTDQLDDDTDPFAEDGGDYLDKNEDQYDPGDNKDGGLGK